MNYWEQKYAECKEDADENDACFWEIKLLARQKKKLKKWERELELCKQQENS